MKAVCNCASVVLLIASTALGALAPSYYVTQGSIFQIGTQDVDGVTTFLQPPKVYVLAGGVKKVKKRCAIVLPRSKYPAVQLPCLLNTPLPPGTYELHLQPRGGDDIVVTRMFTVRAPEIFGVALEANNTLRIEGAYWGGKLPQVALVNARGQTRPCRPIRPLQYANWKEKAGVSCMHTRSGRSSLVCAVPKAIGNAMGATLVVRTKMGNATCTIGPDKPNPVVFAGIQLAYATSPTSAQLAWPEATDNHTPAQFMRYKIYKGATNDPNILRTPANLVTSLTGENSFELSGLTPDTVVYLLMVAENAFGQISTNSNVASLKTMRSQLVTKSSIVILADVVTNYSVADDETAITIDGDCRSLFTTGMIVAVEHNGAGLLKNVAAVLGDNVRTILQVEDAYLTDVIDEGQVRSFLYLPDANTLPLQPAFSRLENLPAVVHATCTKLERAGYSYYVHPEGRYIVSRPSPEYLGMQQSMGIDMGYGISVSASASFDPSVTWDADVGWTGLRKAEVIATATLSLNASITANADAHVDFTREREIPGTKYTVSTWYDIGPLPVQQDLEFALYARLEFSSDSTMRATAHFTAEKSVRVGLQWERNVGWQHIYRSGFTRSARFDLSKEFGAHVVLVIYPKVKTTIYKTAYTDFSIFPELSLDVEGDQVTPSLFSRFDVRFRAGMQFGAGFDLFGWSKEYKSPYISLLDYVTLFSLPSLSYRNAPGSGYTDVSKLFAINVSDGVLNPVPTANISWWLSPSSGAAITPSSDRRSATFVASKPGTYSVNVSAYGSGILGVLGKQVRVTDIDIAQSYYTLTVNNGSGGGSYVEGERVDIVADDPPSGKVFDKWSGATQYINNPTRPSTYVIMPAQNITVSAQYKAAPTHPVLAVSPTRLNPSSVLGQNAASDSFDVWNAGDGNMSYTISDDATWLSVTPTSGSSSGETDSIAVNYATSGLAAGTYNATITVTASGASGSPKTIGVTLTVSAQPTYTISGRVSGDTQQGVTMNLTGAATAQTATDGNGNYSFSRLANGIYTIRPSKSGFTFAPSSTNITLNGTNMNNADFRATQSGGGAGDYAVIDVSGGPTASSYPVTYHTSVPLDDEHKTSKIVLRKIFAGSFTMGSPGNELGRYNDETQHTVTLTKPFYMGIYEITQAQYQNVMGSNPSTFKQGTHTPRRPVENVSWDIVRGGTWPGGSPAGTSFMGKLRSKTGLAFDLPTEAQWEYACRAGTTKALNNNTDLQSLEQDSNMDVLGRYWYNGGSSYSSDPVNGGTAEVGSYQANNWGLYDMHGNVWEWCLDWYGSYGGNATDPNGPGSGSGRVLRGGSWYNRARICRSANRYLNNPGYAYIFNGFRLVLPTGQ